METKKNPSVDINKSRGLFLNIGLVTTLLTTIILFQWNFADPKLGDMVGQASDDDEMEEVIVTEILPPPPPKLEIPQTIEVVDDEEEIEEEPPVFEEPDDNTEIVEVREVVEEEVEEEIFLIVEQSAEPKGGMVAFRTHLANYLSKNYPERAKKAGIQGTVFIKFYVDKDGTTKGFEVLKGIGGGCDEAAIEAIKSYGTWSPPKQRGRAVKQWFNIPVKFRIG